MSSSPIYKNNHLSSPTLFNALINPQSNFSLFIFEANQYVILIMIQKQMKVQYGCKNYIWKDLES